MTPLAENEEEGPARNSIQGPPTISVPIVARDGSAKIHNRVVRRGFIK